MEKVFFDNVSLRFNKSTKKRDKMTSQDIYREICNTEISIPIYCQAWWLDAIKSSHQWDAIIIKDKSNNILAVMPYFLTKRYILMQINT